MIRCCRSTRSAPGWRAPATRSSRAPRSPRSTWRSRTSWPATRPRARRGSWCASAARPSHGTGVGPGFSGSPIYCPGPDGTQRVIGAISESVGEYGNAVALATPIEAIVGETVEPPAAARSAPALLRSARPLAAPLSIGGLSPGVAAAVRRAAARARVPVLAVPAAPQTGVRGRTARARRGDGRRAGQRRSHGRRHRHGVVRRRRPRLGSSAIPSTPSGRRSLFLQDAYVYSVINNPLGTRELHDLQAGGPRARPRHAHRRRAVGGRRPPRRAAGRASRCGSSPATSTPGASTRPMCSSPTRAASGCPPAARRSARSGPSRSRRRRRRCWAARPCARAARCACASRCATRGAADALLQHLRRRWRRQRGAGRRSARPGLQRGRGAAGRLRGDAAARSSAWRPTSACGAACARRSSSRSGGRAARAGARPCGCGCACGGREAASRRAPSRVRVPRAMPAGPRELTADRDAGGHGRVGPGRGRHAAGPGHALRRARDRRPTGRRRSPASPARSSASSATTACGPASSSPAPIPRTPRTRRATRRRAPRARPCARAACTATRSCASAAQRSCA